MVAHMSLIPPHIASQKYAELLARPDVAAMLAQQGDGVSYSGSNNNNAELGQFTSQVIANRDRSTNAERHI